MILLALADAGLAHLEYTRCRSTGRYRYGRASKEQMQEMVRLLLQLQAIPQPDDAADGLAMAICHATRCLRRSGWPEMDSNMGSEP